MNPVRNPLYVPRGKAGEYGEYAVNIYTGCPHNCPYCYVPNVLHISREEFHSRVEPRTGIVEGLEKQLRKMREEGITGKLVHLCFTCDPFPTGYDCTPTLDVIRVLKEYGNHVQILTKGDGTPCLDLLDENDWYGVTVDGGHGNPPDYCHVYRAADLAKAKEKGIKTWVSCEPVLHPDTVLHFLRRYGNYADKIKIGKLNYHKPPKPIDWAQFGRDAVLLCDNIGLDYYIKDGLREQMRGSMSREEFTEFIYDEWNVGDNCTLGPELLYGAIAYAGGLNPEGRRAFFKEVLPSIPEILFECIRY